MTGLGVALIIVVWAVLIFAWSLCAAAARGDRRIQRFPRPAEPPADPIARAGDPGTRPPRHGSPRAANERNR